MRRRQFLASTLAASASAGLLPGSELAPGPEEAGKVKPEYYELRLYHLRRGPKVKLFDDFYRDAAVPAFNRAGIKTVGVFNVMIGPASPTLHVLIPYPSLDAIAATHNRVLADAEFLKVGAEVLNAPPTDPAFVRMENSLMVAFDIFPKLEVPPGVAEKRRRIFELRTYESHSSKAHRTKIEMFGKGEVDMFRRAGLRPVFFGSTIVGSRLPNLTYMLTFANMEEHDKGWAAFGADPDWKKLSTTPGYTDGEIVSNITNVFLTPTSYSQI